MKKWMYDCIMEAPQNCMDILKNKETLLNGLVSKYCSGEYDEIVIAASGSSYNIASCAKYAMEELLDIKVDVIYSITYAEYAFRHHKNAFVICTSQGGRSTNTIAAYRRALSCGNDTVVLVSEHNTPLEEECGDTYHFGNDTAGADVFVCRGVPTSVLFLDLFALMAAKEKGLISGETYDSQLLELQTAITKMEDVRNAADRFYEMHKKDFYSMERAMVAGIGSGQGVAQEGALKLEETAGIPSNWYEMEEFLHGPVYEIKKGHAIFLIDLDRNHHDRAMKIFSSATLLTDRVYLVSNQEADGENVLHIDCGISSHFLPLLFVIPFQVFASRLCDDTRASGITIYTYRFMQKVATKKY